MAAFTPSIHVFLGRALVLLSRAIHFIINFGILSSLNLYQTKTCFAASEVQCHLVVFTLALCYLFVRCPIIRNENCVTPVNKATVPPFTGTVSETLREKNMEEE